MRCLLLMLAIFIFIIGVLFVNKTRTSRVENVFPVATESAIIGATGSTGATGF